MESAVTRRFAIMHPSARFVGALPQEIWSEGWSHKHQCPSTLSV